MAGSGKKTPAASVGARAGRQSHKAAVVGRSPDRTGHELEVFRAALDEISTGVLLLDRNLRAVYANRAGGTILDVLSQDFIVKSKPHYANILRRASQATASSDERQDYIERRLKWVESADPTPMDINRSDGRTIRSEVFALVGGGYMLTYSDVTDMTRNAQHLERLATTDGMTGIYNRRHFMTLAEREWEKSIRYKQPLSLLIFDIDFFKSINDSFGHEVGDKMIVHVVNLAIHTKRASDVLARIGGEEFAMLLPNASLRDASQVAERVRSVTALSPLTSHSGTIQGTISIGVAALSEKMRTFDEFMRSADQALYAAKRAGRNCVKCAGPEDAVPTLADTPTLAASSQDLLADGEDPHRRRLTKVRAARRTSIGATL